MRGGDSVSADGRTLNVNSLLFGIGNTGEVTRGVFAGEDRADGGAAGTNGGEATEFWRGERTGRGTVLEGLKPGG